MNINETFVKRQIIVFIVLIIITVFVTVNLFYYPKHQAINISNNNKQQYNTKHQLQNKPKPPPTTTTTPYSTFTPLNSISTANNAILQLNLKPQHCPFLSKPNKNGNGMTECITSESCGSSEFCHPERNLCSPICRTPLLLPKKTPSDMIPHQDDVFIVSYPKSGSTWLRHLITNLHKYKSLQQSIEKLIRLGVVSSTSTSTSLPPNKPSTFQQVDTFIPFLEDKASGNIHDLFTKKQHSNTFPRIFKTHQPWQCDVSPCKGWMVGRQAKWQCSCPTCASKFQRVIYVLRDGRAAMFSYFKFQKELKLRGRTNTFSKFLKYKQRRYPGCSWSDHIRSWLAAPSNVDILWIHYENLLSQTNIELKRVADFLQVETNNKAIEWSVQASNRNSMRKTEEETGAGLFSSKYKKRDKSFMMTHNTLESSKWHDQFGKGQEENDRYWNFTAGYMSKCLKHY